MNEYCIVGYPHSSELIEQGWFDECVPYEGDAYLVPEWRVVDLFGQYHRFDLYNPRLERLHENNWVKGGQLHIEFDM